ncbi:MAG: subunit of tubulin prefoldin [Vezdaea aestivalis]|nr:MAG: subunit of tubulin prefoldin [Vezdaea aestivalis]
MAAGGKTQSLDLSTLSLQQLSAVKKQLDEELEHLTSSFAKLKGAQNKFGECLKTIDKGVGSATDGKEILVPLTTSLYVPGRMADTKNVIVDVGTGFYVEKLNVEPNAQSADDAKKFYKRKVADLGKNLKDLETIVQSKSGNLRIVEDG